MEQEQQQQRQGEERQIIKQLDPYEVEAIIKARKEAEAARETARLAAETRGGNITEYLPVGSYVCPTKGEAKAAYGDYIRIHRPGDIPEEEKEKIAAAPMKEFREETYLLPGSYVCPTKGEAKRVYGDYRRIGDPGTFPDA